MGWIYQQNYNIYGTLRVCYFLWQMNPHFFIHLPLWKKVQFQTSEVDFKYFIKVRLKIISWWQMSSITLQNTSTRKQSKWHVTDPQQTTGPQLGDCWQYALPVQLWRVQPNLSFTKCKAGSMWRHTFILRPDKSLVGLDMCKSNSYYVMVVFCNYVNNWKCFSV